MYMQVLHVLVLLLVSVCALGQLWTADPAHDLNTYDPPSTFNTCEGPSVSLACGGLSQAAVLYVDLQPMQSFAIRQSATTFTTVHETTALVRSGDSYTEELVQCTASPSTEPHVWANPSFDVVRVYFVVGSLLGDCGNTTVQWSVVNASAFVAATGSVQVHYEGLAVGRTRTYSTHSRTDCLRYNTQYTPFDDIPGQARTVESSAKACQARCASVQRCAYFTFWADGGCHLSTAAGVLGPRPEVVVGPAVCRDEGCSNPGIAFVPFDIPGENRTLEPNATACQDRCASVTGCRYYTFFAADGSCRLSGNVSPRVVRYAGATSGPANCTDADRCFRSDVVVLPLDNIVGSPIVVPTATGCQAHCLNVSGCEWFLYQSNTGQCATASGQATPRFAVTTTGPPSCGGHTIVVLTDDELPEDATLTATVLCDATLLSRRCGFFGEHPSMGSGLHWSWAPAYSASLTQAITDERHWRPVALAALPEPAWGPKGVWIWANDAEWRALAVFRIHTAKAACVGVDCTAGIATCVANGRCNTTTGACEYDVKPDGALCHDGLFFDYRAGFRNVWSSDQCVAGQCVARRAGEVWRHYAGRCVSASEEPLPYVWKQGMSPSACQRECAQSAECLAYDVTLPPTASENHSTCSLYVAIVWPDDETHTAADFETLMGLALADWHSIGLSSDPVIGAVVIPYQTNPETCYLRAFFTIVGRVVLASEAVDTFWAPDGQFLAVRLVGTGSPGAGAAPSAQVYYSGLGIQRQTYYDGHYALAYGPGRQVALATQTDQIVVRTDPLDDSSFFELLGTGDCVGGTVKLQRLLQWTARGAAGALECRRACAIVAECAAYSANTCLGAGVQCRMYSETALAVDADGVSCGFCERKVVLAKSMQLLGPGICQGLVQGQPGLRDVNGAVLTATSQQRCERACVDRGDRCTGYTMGFCGEAQGTCVLHTPGGENLKGTHNWDEGAMEVLASSGQQCYACYVRQTSHMVVLSASSVSRPACSAPAGAPRTLASRAVSHGHQCRALCSQASATVHCVAWRYATATSACPTGPRPGLCLLYTVQASTWVPPWPGDWVEGSQAVALSQNCCPVAGHRMGHPLLAIPVPNVCQSPGTRGEWQFVQLDDGFGPTGDLQWRLDSSTVTVRGNVACHPGPTACPAVNQSSEWHVFGWIPAAVAPAQTTRHRLVGWSSTPAVDMMIRPDGALALRVDVATPTSALPHPYVWRVDVTLIPKTCALSIQHLSGRVHALHFSPDGRFLAAVTAWQDPELHRALLFDLEAASPGQQVGNWTLLPWMRARLGHNSIDGVPGPDATVLVVQFTPDSRFVALHRSTDAWEVRHCADGALVRTFRCGLTFSVHQDFVVCVHGTQSYVTEYVSGLEVASWFAVARFVVAKSSSFFVVAVANEPTWLYNATAEWSRTAIVRTLPKVMTVGISPDEQYVAVVGFRSDATLANAMYHVPTATLRFGSWAEFVPNGLLFEDDEHFQLRLQFTASGAMYPVLYPPDATTGIALTDPGTWSLFQLFQFPTVSRWHFSASGYGVGHSRGQLVLLDVEPERTLPGRCQAVSAWSNINIHVPEHILTRNSSMSECFSRCIEPCYAAEYGPVGPTTGNCRRFGPTEQAPEDFRVAITAFKTPGAGDASEGFACGIKGTPTPTATPTTSKSATLSGTVVPTRTPTSTPSTTVTGTPVIPACASVSAGSAVTLQAASGQVGGLCSQALRMGKGSSTLQTASLWVVVLRLQTGGQLVLRLGSACTSDDPDCPLCSSCERHYDPSHVGASPDRVPLSSTSQLDFTFQFTDTASSLRRSRATNDTDAFEVVLTVDQRPSLLFTLAIVLGTFIGTLTAFVGGCLWYRARDLAAPDQHDAPELDQLHMHNGKQPNNGPKQPKRCSTQHFALLVLFAIVLVDGIVCCTIAIVYWSGYGHWPFLLWAGVVACSLALLGFIVIFLREMWYPDTGVCPACGDPLSHWRSLSVSVPQPERSAPATPTASAPASQSFASPADAHPTQTARYHWAHAKCVHCGRRVTRDRWRLAPHTRLYHSDCWSSVCDHVLEDAEDAAKWYLRHEKKVSHVELGVVSAAAILRGKTDVLGCLLRLHPSLYRVPVPEYSGQTLVSLAAREGNLPALRLLLEYYKGLPAPTPSPDFDCSLAVAGMGSEVDDVYVYQPVLRYNAEPVYVGLKQGKYLYYYEAPAGAAPKIHGPRSVAGWCISPILGSGVGPFRLALGTMLEAAAASARHPARAVPVAQVVQESPRHTAAEANRLSRSMSSQEFAPGDPQPSAADARHFRWLDKLKQKAHGLSSTVLHYFGDDQRDQTLCSIKTTATPIASYGSTVQIKLVKDDVLRLVPHAVGLLEAAAASGRPDVMAYVLDLHLKRYPQCFAWQYLETAGMWQNYDWGVQVQIRDAVRGCSQRLEAAQPTGKLQVDLAACTATTAHGTHRIRHLLLPMLLYGSTADLEAGLPVLTSNPADVPDISVCTIITAPGHATAAAPSAEALEAMVTRGMVDPTFWALPCADPQRFELQKQDLLLNVLHGTIEDARYADALAHPSSGEEKAFLRKESERRRSTWGSFAQASMNICPQAGSGMGNRMGDGLQDPQQEGQLLVFYQNDYRPQIGLLTFVCGLPDNDQGYVFFLEGIMQLVRDGLAKWAELSRQHTTLKPLHVLSLFIYSYQLPDEGGSNQIYEALNRAMRDQDPQSVAFWRPMIFYIDTALAALPPWKGKVYRGIDCKFSNRSYKTGATVFWPSFSSASTERSVAEEFAKGDAGTLFFVQGTSARAISACSRYPEEAEVIFRPNTRFQITSTLYSSSEIGAFYSAIDNIAMSEASLLGVEPREMLTSHVLLQVPMDLMYDTISHTAALPGAAVQSVDVINSDDGQSLSACIVFAADAAGLQTTNSSGESSTDPGATMVAKYRELFPIPDPTAAPSTPRDPYGVNLPPNTSHRDDEPFKSLDQTSIPRLDLSPFHLSLAT